MESNDNEISSICQQITMEKWKIRSAISQGVIFEEVKKIVLNLREIERKLDDCINRQLQWPGNSNQTGANGS